MKLDELISRLGKLKGSGGWQKLADASGVNYFTIARIYRSEIPNPGIRTVDKLAVAIERLDAKPTGKKASAPAASAGPIAIRGDGTVVEKEERGRLAHKEPAYLRILEDRRNNRPE